MADTHVSDSKRILHFDTNDSTRKVTTTGLRLQGFSVTEANTLEAALERADNASFDAAIIDCHPAEDAETLTEHLGEMDPPVPVVLVTSRANRVPFEGARDHACLVRPFATPALALVLGPLAGVERNSTELEAEQNEAFSEESLTPTPEMVQVGEYQLITEIARGGMGTVYVARRMRDAGVNRLYALKLLHPHLSDDEKFVSMLRDEASLASRINHQNVVSVNDVGSDGDEQHFIVMDYVEGLSLSKLTKRKGGSIPEDILASIFVDALEGLHGAHIVTDGRGNSMDLVHRDVSPENILVGTDGAARISDFGVAKARIRLTHTLGDERKGKLAYLSPEQLIDDDTVDRRVDLWAAGVSLWGSLTGVSLFAEGADSEAKILRRILEHEVSPPSAAGRKPDSFLDAVTLRALERDLSERFQTAREMSEAIREAAMSAGLLASKAAVGEFVLSACEAEVRERREIARLSLTPVSSTTGRAADAAELVATRVDPSVQVDDDDGKRRAWPFFLLGVAAAAALGVGWYAMQPAASPRSSAPPEASERTAAAQVEARGVEAEAHSNVAEPDGAPKKSTVGRDEPGEVDEAEAEPEPEVPEKAEPEAAPKENSPRPSRRPTRRRKPTASPEPDPTPKAEPAPKPKQKADVTPDPVPDPDSKKSDALSEPNPYR